MTAKAPPFKLRATARLRILLLDIETAPIESYHWRLWKENIGLKQIKVDWSILSFSAKWLSEKKIVYYDSFDEKDIRNDSPLLWKLHELLEEADVVIAHNGREFDLKKIRARMLIQGLPPFSPVRVIDTLEASKKHFGFTSNKLAYLSVLGGEEKYASKKFVGFELWSEFLAHNPAARAEMKKYNSIDITSLEAYYLKIRPWIEAHPDVNIPTDSHEISCPKCGSLNMRSNGTRYTQTGAYPRYRCNDCGGSSWNKSSLLSLHKRKNILGN